MSNPRHLTRLHAGNTGASNPARQRALTGFADKQGVKFFFHRLAGQNRAGAMGSPAPVSLGLATLIELFDGDRAAVIRLLQAAIVSIESNTTEIDIAMTGNDPTAIVEAAHRLKGTSSSIGASGLIELGSRIEGAARATPPVMTAALMRELRAGVTIVAAEIAAYSRSPA